MAIETNQSPNRQIRDFLTVIIGGGLFGLLVVFGLVYYYAPSDTVKAKNALVSPDVLSKLWYSTSNASTKGDMTRFAFSKIEFLYFDEEDGQWHSLPVDIETYGNFYQAVAKDSGKIDEYSVVEAPQARLLILGSTRTGGISDVFQEILLSSDDVHYTVQLRGETQEKKWANFTHEGIMTKLKSLMKGL